MKSKTQLVILAALSGSLMLGACGGGGDDDGGDGGNGGGNVTERSFSAQNEARRYAVSYRVSRDLLSIAFPYVKNGAVNEALGGTTADCLSGGTASYTYMPGPSSGNPNTLQTLRIFFDGCIESIGEINGTMTVQWSGQNEELSSGTFTPGLRWNITVGELTYIRNDISGVVTNFNDGAGYQQSSLNFGGTGTLQGPTGPSLRLDNPFMRIERASASATTVTFSNVRGKLLDNAGSQSGYLVTGQSFTAAVAPSSSVVQGIGTPTQGSITYSRTRADLPSLSGTVGFSSGMMTVDVGTTMSSNEPRDSGTFTWDDALANLIFVQRGF